MSQLSFPKLLERQQSGRATPGRVRSLVKRAFDVHKIYFPTYPAMDNGFVQDVLLKVIKSTVPETARVHLDFRECSVLKFDPNAKSWMYVEFVPFGKSSTGSPYALDATTSSDPAMCISYENSNRLDSCYVCYQESVDTYHYAKTLGEVPTPLFECSVPAKNHLVAPKLAMLDTFPQIRTIVDLAHLGIEVRVIPLDVTAGLAFEIRSMFDSAGAIFRCTGTDQRGIIRHRKDERIF
jgi:hypothetical protein